MERRLAAILVADVAGYSRLTGVDEEGTLSRYARLRAEVIDPAIADHSGRVFKTTGDGVLACFPSVVEAVRCAAQIQQSAAEKSASTPSADRIVLRIGIHVGDVVASGDDLLGEAVNIAARLEPLATPGGVCVSGPAYEQVRDRLPLLTFTDAGEHALHNIVRPVRVWHLRLDGGGEQHSTITGTNRHASVPGPETPQDRPAIAVLPLANLSGDPGQDYFSDGMTEEIITAVSRFRGLLVIARNASFAMRGREADASQVGAELGADYLLQGSIRRAGDRVRVSAQLIDAPSGRQLWAERFDRTLADVLDVQDEIAGRIVAAVAPQIREAEIERARQPGRTFSLSYDLSLRAQVASEEGRRNSDRARIEEALALAREATRTEPVSPRAFHALALVSLRLADLSYFPADDAPRALAEARDAAERLAELEPANHMAYMLLGSIAIQQQRGDEARRMFQRAYDLNANDPMAAAMLSWAESNDGLAAQALAHVQDALLRTPLGRDRRMMLWTLALAHWAGGDPASAVPHLREAIAGRRGFVQRYGLLIVCLAELGQLDEARRLLAEAEDVAPDYVQSRLEGKNWFTEPTLAGRFTAALRKAAGLEPA